jgi:hypothetical protein
MRTLLVVLTLLSVFPLPNLATAADGRVSVSHIGIHLHTVHSSRAGACARWKVGWDGWAPYQTDCTDSTPGAFVRLNERWIFGYYRNSIGRDSFYAGRTWQLVDQGWVQLELTAGLLSGYKPGHIGPLLLPSASFPLSPRARLQLVPIPKIPGKHGPSALHLALEVRL